jgi:hypothetical protein
VRRRQWQAARAPPPAHLPRRRPPPLSFCSALLALFHALSVCFRSALSLVLPLLFLGRSERSTASQIT